MAGSSGSCGWNSRPAARRRRNALPGESLVLVEKGTVLRDLGDGEPRSFSAGDSFDGAAPHRLRTDGAVPAWLLVGTIAAPDAMPRPLDPWERAE